MEPIQELKDMRNQTQDQNEQMAVDFLLNLK